jgi:hypothetical protein
MVMGEEVKTEQMRLGPGFILKAIKELGLPTVLVCLMSVGIYMLWNVSRQDLQKAMASASEERQAIYKKHAEERDQFMKEVTERLDKIRRDVRRDKNCRTDED